MPEAISKLAKSFLPTTLSAIVKSIKAPSEVPALTSINAASCEATALTVVTLISFLATFSPAEPLSTAIAIF